MQFSGYFLLTSTLQNWFLFVWSGDTLFQTNPIDHWLYFKVYQHQQPSLLPQHCQAAQESKVGAETYQHHENCANLIARMMVIGAWLTTLLFSLPQAVIFRVLRHPLVEFYQCTTWGYFENLATSNITQGEPQHYFRKYFNKKVAFKEKENLLMYYKAAADLEWQSNVIN